MKASKLLRVALEGETEETVAPAEVSAQPTEVTETAAPVETPAVPEAAAPAPVATETPAAEPTETSAPEVNAEVEAEPADQRSSKLESEKELVIYAKIANFEQLKACKVIEHQEQYEVKLPKTDKNAVSGRIRCRKIVKGDKEPKFEVTTKTKLPDGSEYESDCKTTEENFVQFKYFCEGGMIKDRHIFPVEGHKGLKWEIDVFTGTNGLYHEWCKIDLEIDGDLPTLPPFPIDLTDIITNQEGSRTPEEETIIRTLYDTVFRTPNPIISAKQ